MKNVSIINIIIISVLVSSLFFGNFDYSVYCVAEECCKTECCEVSSNSVYSGLHLSFNDADCCEYNQAFENEIQTVSSLNNGVKENLTAPSILQHQIPDAYDCCYNAKKPTSIHVPVSHSISILRI